MKKSASNRAIYTMLFILFMNASSCVKKNPGPGGSSAITGKITGREYNPGELEIQQFTFTNGSQLEHGDYFLINEVKNGDNYYIYFKNPNWVSPADPGLQGRIGLEVIFNYSDSNIEIAQAVKNKLNALGVLAFNMTIDNDILTLNYKNRMAVPDPDNGTTNFAIDIVNQGSDDYTSNVVLNMAEQRVYLCYGDEVYPSEEVKTNPNGEFIFTNLQNGIYKVYVIGELPPHDNQTQEVSAIVTIAEKESNNDIGTLQIYF